MARRKVWWPELYERSMAGAEDRGERTSPRHCCTSARRLLADAEFLNDLLVALGVVFLKVVEQTPPLAHHHQKPAPRRVVFLVRFEMLRQLANALA